MVISQGPCESGGQCNLKIFWNSIPKPQTGSYNFYRQVWLFLLCLAHEIPEIFHMTRKRGHTKGANSDRRKWFTAFTASGSSKTRFWRHFSSKENRLESKWKNGFLSFITVDWPLILIGFIWNWGVPLTFIILTLHWFRNKACHLSLI